MTNVGGIDWISDAYDYNTAGNVLSHTYDTSEDSPEETLYSFYGDLMDTASGGDNFTLGWDKNGNLTTGVGATLTYNWDNKLRQATKDTATINLKYDPQGNRIFKGSSANGNRKYIVDIVGDLPTILLEINPDNGSITKAYVYANSQILMQHNGTPATNNKYFYLHDRLGSVREIIDTAGDVVRHYTYGPFGETIEESNAGPQAPSNAFLFTGQYYDSETGQYYLRARQYDPVIFRFTRRDPVAGKFEEPMTLHKYLYCGNDPINKIDPWGLWAMYLTLTGSAQFVGAGGGQVGLTWDDNGNVGLITVENYGVGTPQQTLGASFGWSPVADTISDLAGWGWASGASAGWLGFEGFLGDNNIWGYEVTMGHSIIPLPVEGHLFRTKTTIEPKENFNWRDTIKEVRESWDDAMYEAQTIGEFYKWAIVGGMLDEL